MTSRLSTQLLPFSDAERSLAEIRQSAEHKGLVPIFNEVSYIYMADLSIMVVGQELEVFIHLPLHRPPSYSLYRWIDVPLFVPKLNTTIIPQPHHDFIAVSPQQEIFCTFSASYLQSCQKLGSMTYCAEEISFRKDVKNSCLAALYHNAIDGILKTCKFNKPSNLNDLIIPVGVDELLLYSPIKSEFRINCSKYNTSQLLVGTGYRRITLRESCSVSSDNAFLQKEPSIRSPSPLRTSFTMWSGDRLLEGLEDEPFNASAINLELRDTQSVQVALNESLKTLEAYVQSQAVNHWSHYSSVGHSALLLLIVPFLLCILVMICRRKCSALQQQALQ